MQYLLTSKPCDLSETGIKIRRRLANMGCDNVLKMGCCKIFQSIQESVTNAIDLGIFDLERFDLMLFRDICSFVKSFSVHGLGYIFFSRHNQPGSPAEK